MNLEKIKKDWEIYFKKTEDNDIVDADLHYSMAMEVGGLIRTIEQIKKAYRDREGDIEALEGTLKEIDTHIRSTSNPVPYIVKTLKATLPEYNEEIY